MCPDENIWRTALVSSANSTPMRNIPSEGEQCRTWAVPERLYFDDWMWTGVLGGISADDSMRAPEAEISRPRTRADRLLEEIRSFHARSKLDSVTNLRSRRAFFASFIRDSCFECHFYRNCPATLLP